MRRQTVIGVSRWADFAEQLDHSPRYFWRHWCAAASHFPNALQQAGGRRAFQQIPTGAGADGVENPLVVVVYREHHQQHAGITFLQAADAFNSGHPRECDIEQDNLRWVPVDCIQSFFHGTEAAGALVTRSAVYECLDTLSGADSIFDDCHADIRCLAGFGHGFVHPQSTLRPWALSPSVRME